MLFCSYLDISIARDVMQYKGKTILFHAFSVHFGQQKRPIMPRHRPFIPVLCRVYSVFSTPGRDSNLIDSASLSTRSRSMATFVGYPAALQSLSIQSFSPGGTSKTSLLLVLMIHHPPLTHMVSRDGMACQCHHARTSQYQPVPH